MLPACSLRPAVANAAMDKLAPGGCSGRIRGSLPWSHLCRCSDFLFLLLKKQQHFVSSATSTSAGAVMGALECPAVGSSAFSSPLVELSAWFLL